MILMAVLFYLLGTHVLGDRALEPGIVHLMSGMSGFIFLFCVLMGVISVFLTHRVAGAAYRLEKCIKGMAGGDLDLRIALRKRDYLQNLAEALNQLQGTLRAQAEARARLAAELESYREALEKDSKLSEDDRRRIDGWIDLLRSKPSGQAEKDKEQPSPV